MARTAAPTPFHARRNPPVPGLHLPVVQPTGDAMLDHDLARRLQPPTHDARALGRLQTLALQLARMQAGHIRTFDRLQLDHPQLLVFAGDHGLVDEGISDWPAATTHEHVEQLLAGTAPASVLALRQGFDVTVVDAGVATPINRPARNRGSAVLLPRKIGYGTRNSLLGPAMSQAQAVSALHAGMDVVRHLPGTVVALGDIGVAGEASASLLLARLCGVPVEDAFVPDETAASSLDDTVHRQRLGKLQSSLQRHALAMSPMHALAAFGGFETAMLVGAMLQAASERRVVLVDGFVAGAAALVARGLCPAVVDYLVFAQRAAGTPHRLLLIHLSAQPLIDLELKLNQGTGAMLAWPMLTAAQALLDAGA